jgi:hypothetical protein
MVQGKLGLGKTIPMVTWSCGSNLCEFSNSVIFTKYRNRSYGVIAVGKDGFGHFVVGETDFSSCCMICDVFGNFTKFEFWSEIPIFPCFRFSGNLHVQKTISEVAFWLLPQNDVSRTDVGEITVKQQCALNKIQKTKSM